MDRRDLWRAQTPQGFRYIDILDAHRTCTGQELTDDASIAEHAGLSVALVRGSEDNFKITTVDDLERAQRMTEYSPDEFRIGTGFDVHALVDGDHVILCGVRIDHSHGLEGHSDADVAMHAVTDALLGAIAEGDIGTHFPPSDNHWCGAASSVFLEHAGRLISERGGRIGNIDVTIICEAPKISPHREAMTSSLARILGIAPDRVSVKATTTEKLGFIGRGQGYRGASVGHRPAGIANDVRQASARPAVLASGGIDFHVGWQRAAAQGAGDLGIAFHPALCVGYRIPLRR